MAKRFFIFYLFFNDLFYFYILKHISLSITVSDVLLGEDKTDFQ